MSNFWGSLHAVAQFKYSQSKSYIGVTEQSAPKYKDISCFLSLFEHMYDLPDTGLLEDAQQKLDQWLAQTFAWERWEHLVRAVQQARFIYIEPNNLWYTISGAKISARMDLGLETADGKFVIYDWKCYSDDIKFADLNEKNFRHQLLTYSLWPTLRQESPISIRGVTTHIFYPTLNRTLDFTFQEEDLWDFELQVERWVGFHEQVFTEISDVDFQDLSGPYDSQRSCPRCEFKSVCRENIEWHTLK